ncbi:MAG: hypothetical protein ACLFTR_03360 [Candidatus Woesearchaeota archaeon]
MKSTTWSSGDRDWNDNLGFLERIDTRFNEANEASNQGYLVSWYRSLRTIYRIMHFKIHQDKETRKLDNEELKVDDWLTKRFNAAKSKVANLHKDFKGSRTMAEQMQANSITEGETILDDIDTVLSDLYVKYFIRLEAKSTEPSEAIREVFK